MKASLERRNLVSSHWGIYEPVADPATGQIRALRGLPEDPDPSPIGLAMLDANGSPLRVRRPAVRAGWLDRETGASRLDTGRGRGRGREPFVEVPWDTALELVAAELERVRTAHGNASIFGGSYGWSSAGRFHHAQSQVHRFLNSIGGYVRHADSYSLGAARVLMPHIVASMDELMAGHHGWDVLAAHTKLFVSFGGVPAKNAQISAGGTARHRVREGLASMASNGCRFVNFSPVGADLEVPGAGAVEWVPIRPNTDTAIMLALACETILAGSHDEAFLASHCVGFERWRDYLLGEADGIVKNADWAAPITGVPARRIRALAAEMATVRTLVNVSWSVQRADHGEQPYWAAVALAAVLGQIGLPGGGFGAGYGAVNLIGSPERRFAGPTLPQGRNAVSEFIPVARIADMLLRPGETFRYNGGTHRYPDIRLVYWAGGNPFHHHQDLNRLARAWQRPETIVVHEQVWTPTARMADIVLPATTTLEREDIGYSTREALIVAMKPICVPPGEARDDYTIFGDLARRLGAEQAFTEGLDARAWLRRLYEDSIPHAAAAGFELPPFEAFWDAGALRLPEPAEPVVMLGAFREDPHAAPLRTPSGKVEIHSERIAGFALADCPGHPVWLAPREWLGAAQAEAYPLHLISDQPFTKLHSQLDFSSYSVGARIKGREPAWIHPEDAGARGIADGDLVRVFNDRGACLAAAVVTDRVAPRVVKLSTGAWWDPVDPGTPGSLDKHGNPNVLTRDEPASTLSQGCAAQSCLVQIERFEGEAPPVTAFELPTFVHR
ncbi:molybdopterin-dependent oxidoreductase [Zeimonas arvi]|uniref:Asp-tRNA(Asn)/Glu-tRNA(Gln) amidotransferase GatCAB subunit C n=1 Tax=Zeimonas arvi TaxID=2498847 RepID=A0A5C8NU93_9BURK|nr:molybdopterin-dependent oxidoreductase [Zeimonas arvi]TXL64733.1 Asp-tRNA(Asn)/Glu-tRNA(Gln) amidotransferase GatCAB subunit C [Zeimonas arvi]